MPKTILISAGHTNNPRADRGASGNGLIEGVETLKIRDAVAANLRTRNFTVLEDGSDGINDPLKKALALARQSDIAVELHFNASSNKSATGIECLAKRKHRAFSQDLARAIQAALRLPLRGDLGYKPDNSGQHHRLAFCEANGVIIEVCFISNPQDVAAYKTNFDRLVTNLADVLAKYGA